METTQTSFNRQMDKLWYVHTMEYLLLSDKKEQNIDIYSNLGYSPENYTEF